MGIKLFGVNISGLIDKHISPGVLPATLHQVSQGTRTSGSLAGGPAITETDFAARGFVEDYDESRIDGTIIRRGDRKVLLVGDSIASLTVPTVNDKVTIEGLKMTIVNVKRDPAAATYTCQVRV